MFKSINPASVAQAKKLIEGPKVIASKAASFNPFKTKEEPTTVEAAKKHL
jgi:hypothetical protein